MEVKRLQIDQILKDLQKKMVFIAGPRQVGKTWLAQEVMKQYKTARYLNYDSTEDREVIRDKKWLQNTDLLVFDELHKMPGWKNYLKGLFDVTRVQQQNPVHILVTGSAGLDTYRFKGDSLVGRFFIHHLLPLSPREAVETFSNYDIEQLMSSGGFPQPFLEDKIEADRWRNEYIEGVLKFDVFTLADIRDLNAFRLVFELLRGKVGSPVSISSIAEDVEISSHTVKKYIDILEALYVVFRVTPFSKKIARSIKKEPKIYFFDTGLVKGDRGARVENFVAVNLLKQTFYQRDTKGSSTKLHYIRKRNGQEVDFCLSDEDHVQKVIEVKTSDLNLSKNLLYFSQEIAVPGLQLVFDKDVEMESKGIEVRNIKKYLESMEV